jgi:hypothetical protein
VLDVISDSQPPSVDVKLVWPKTYSAPSPYEDDASSVESVDVEASKTNTRLSLESVTKRRPEAGS